ncbi:MAG: tyrosine-type recombinase/integrase [Planctomycetota bacterium]|jgi:integrase
MSVDIWWYQNRSQWCADVPAEGGRKRLYLGPNEARARAGLHRYMASFYDELGEDASRNVPNVRRSAKYIPLIELAVRFLRWNKTNRAPGTWSNYRDGLKHLTRRHKSKLACELSPSDVEDVKAEMIESGYAARTVNIMVGAVKRMYNWGMKQGLLQDNPIGGVERVSKHVNAPAHPPPKHLPLERARRCIEACRQSPPLGDICELLLLTGMRVGEVVRICWQDVDLQNRMIRLEHHKTSGGPNSRPRTIPLCQRAVKILRAQARPGAGPDGAVLVGWSGRPLTVSALECRLQRLRKRNPELEGFSFHKLRHTCATQLARLKVPERVAQAVLGHSSTLMTRYYTATDPGEMVDAAEKLSARVAGSS